MATEEGAVTTPPGWGSDPLTGYLTDAFRNRLATFVQKRAAYDKLSALDRCFLKIGEGWLNPPDPISPLLFFHSHGAFRSACEHALAGAVGATYPALRSCIESAGYALLIGRRPGLAEVWLKRHDDDASLKAAKAAFTPSAIRAELTPLDGHGAEVFDRLYQWAIDFGGHPNERSVTGSMTMTEADGRTHIQHLYMHGDGLALQNALVETARVGVWALETMQNLYAARYELLGIRAALLDLRRGL